MRTLFGSFYQRRTSHQNPAWSTGENTRHSAYLSSVTSSMCDWSKIDKHLSLHIYAIPHSVVLMEDLADTYVIAFCSDLFWKGNSFRFKCVDMDCDGRITPNEMQYFYEEQLHRMECMAQEPVLFDDICCQMADMINPQVSAKQDAKQNVLYTILYILYPKTLY